MPSNLRARRPTPRIGLAAEVAEVARVADRDRWGVGLMAIGWSHLAVFLACQALYARGDRAESHFLTLWGLDLALALVDRSGDSSAARRKGRPRRCSG